jgi:tRNA G18 (ribose-2'-O)-methylase SpoU
MRTKIARVMQSILDDPALAPYRLVGAPEALRQAGLFAVEGRLVLPRLLASTYRVHSVLLTASARSALAPLLARYPHLPLRVAPAEAISGLTGFDFHRGCLALGYREDARTAEEVLTTGFAGANAPLLVLEGVSNPDNIGGIFRAAHALGAGAVLVGPHCGDPLYRKAIRTSMGATLDLPWAEMRAWPDDLRGIRERGYRLIALTPEAAAPSIREVLGQSDEPVAFVLGSEGDGLSAAARAAAGTAARIPMARPDADSLNIVSAASIALYEAAAR